ncbi:MAG: hypothetical protein KC442_25030 [Thermomicrobiales bacterium]|nr:hypothetical protein [Thermomicrobiales bacterium]
METGRFDQLATEVASFITRRNFTRRLALGSAAAALGLGAVLMGAPSEADARRRRRRRRRVMCHCPNNDPAQCVTVRLRRKARRQHLRHNCDYKGPCQPGVVGTCTPPPQCVKDSDCTGSDVCRDGSCVAGCRTTADCGAGFVCTNGGCVCEDGTMVCNGQCVNDRSDPENCGGCGIVCDPEVSDSCRKGKCTCGDGPACTGEQTCESGECLCPESGECVVTRRALGGWIPTAGGVSFVNGPKDPPLGDGSVQIQTTTVDIAGVRNPTFEGLAIADIEALSYWTYMQDGWNTGVIVPAVRLAINTGLTCSGCVQQVRLAFEPAYYGWGTTPRPQPVQSKIWQQWDLIGPDGRWWTPANLPGFPVNTYVPWSTVLAALPNATIDDRGIYLETNGTPGAVGYVDDVVVNDQIFNFEQ